MKVMLSLKNILQIKWNTFQQIQGILIGSVLFLLLNQGLSWNSAQAQAPHLLVSPLTTGDRLAIQELNSRYFYAIDGLDALIPGDPARNWANTFTSDGTFSIVGADGKILSTVQGTADLIKIFSTFPDISTTRHWINDLLIEIDENGAKSGCYIIAMNVQDNPATTIRTGIYQDRLVKLDSGQWKFQSRKLILDPNSPAG